MVILVTGGRRYHNSAYVNHVLDFLLATRGVTLVVEGGANGADTHARKWAKSRGVDVDTCEADWQTYQNHAGLARNVHMLNKHRYDLVVAFSGGNGTAHMVRIAKAAGYSVLMTAKYERIFNERHCL